MYLITLEGVFTSERQRFLMDQGYQFNVKRDAHIEAQVTAHTSINLGFGHCHVWGV